MWGCWMWGCPLQHDTLPSLGGCGVSMSRGRILHSHSRSSLRSAARAGSHLSQGRGQGEPLLQVWGVLWGDYGIHGVAQGLLSPLGG